MEKKQLARRAEIPERVKKGRVVMDIKTLALTEVVPSPFNTRKHCDETKLKELAESIKQKGLIEPVVVRPLNGKFELVCGERRFRASKMAGLTDIVARVVKLDDKEALEFQVIENLQREDIHPLEEAEGYESLMKKHGYKTVDDVAVKVGKSRGYIYGRLKLCDLIPDNRKLFYDGKLSPSTALLVARIPTHLQKEAGKEIVKGETVFPVSYERVKRLIENRLMLQLKEACFDTKDKTLAGKNSCLECLKRTGNQKELFPDVKGADICIDPTCFQDKKNAFIQRQLHQIKAKGNKLLTLEESRKLFPYDNTSPEGSKYYSLDEQNYHLTNFPKYRDLIKGLKDKPDVVYAIQPRTGEVIELVERIELNSILKKLGVKSVTAGSSSDVSRARAQEKIRKIVLGKIMEALIEKVRSDKELTFMRIMAQGALSGANEATERLFILRRDPKLKRDQVRPAIEEHLKAVGDSELLGFCLELMMCAEAEWHGYGDTATKLSKHYGIDIKKIENCIRNENKKV